MSIGFEIQIKKMQSVMTKTISVLLDGILGHKNGSILQQQAPH